VSASPVPSPTPPFDEDFVRGGAEGMAESDLGEVQARAEELRRRFDQPGPIGHLRSNAHLLIALVRDYRSGRYREVPWWAMAAVGFCLLYVLNPVDVVPDALPLLGQIDDAIVISVCLVLIDQELQTYKRWKLDRVEADDAS